MYNVGHFVWIISPFKVFHKEYVFIIYIIYDRWDIWLSKLITYCWSTLSIETILLTWFTKILQYSKEIWPDFLAMHLISISVFSPVEKYYLYLFDK